MGITTQNAVWDSAISAAIGTEIEREYASAMQMLFAACLRTPYDFHQVADQITAKWFEATMFADAAAAMFAQHNAGHRFSVPSIAHDANRDQSELFALAQSSNGIDVSLAFELAEPVYKRWIEHRVVQEAIKAISEGVAADEVRDRSETIRRDYGAFNDDTHKDEISAFDEWVKNKTEGKEEFFMCRPHLRALTEQTRLIKGFRPGSFTIIAARPSMGKTQLALNTANSFANNGVRGLFFSVEMGESDLMRRLIGIKTGINPESDWSLLGESDKMQIWNAAESIKNSPCKIVGNVSNILHLVSVARAEHYRQPIHYIILDYIQLLSGKSERNGNREQEISGISRALKLLAKSLNIPVIALAQLSRDVEKRGGDRRPQLSDLRESGSLEQDADIVMFPHRPEYYGIEQDEEGNSMKGVAEIIIRKQRNGKIGAVRCRWDDVRGFVDETDKYFPETKDFTMPVNRSEDTPF